jgi:ribosomal protein L7/L12
MSEREMAASEVARELLAEGRSPVESIKTIREGFALDLGEAKTIVHRHLTPEQQSDAESLWDAAEAAFREEE